MLKYRVFLLCMCVSGQVWSQVLDDSTRQVYSNKTVQFFYENDVLRNISRNYHPDSTLKNYHLTSPLRRSGWMFQDLGNVGTAARALFLQKREEAGQQMGMEAFGLYAPNVSQTRYFNTRSPYTYLAYQQGGGHSEFQVTHSQNLHPRLNITLEIFKFNASKQYGYLRSEEVLVNHWKYHLSGNYLSKNGKYRLMGAFHHFNHKHFEQGGIGGGDTLSLSRLESKYSRNYDAALKGNIFNRERWNNFHIYQQFVLKNALQTFHTFDYERKFYGFEDPSFTDTTSARHYRIATPAQIDTLRYHYRFHTIANKFGFKGLYRGFNYQVYVRSRFYQLTNTSFPEFSQKWKPELFLGGLVGYVFPDSTQTLDVKMEVESHRNYLLDAALRYRGFEIDFYNAASPAGLFYQRFTNGIVDYRATAGLDAVNEKQLGIKFPLTLRSFRVVPEARWSSVHNYTYLQDVDVVVQATKDLNVLTLGLTAGFSGRNLDARYKVLFNQNNSQSIYPLPTWMHHANIEFNFLYARVLRIYTGIDVFLQSRYKGLYYSPLVNHFIAVQGQNVGGVPVADFYLKFPISKGRIALNWQFFNKGMGWNGVFTTPGYVGQPGALLLKIDWPLFD